MKKYIVREGDTMWEISKATGVRLNLLLAANPQVTDPNQLQPGSLIVIPELGKDKLTSQSTQGTQASSQPASAVSGPLTHKSSVPPTHAAPGMPLPPSAAGGLVPQPTKPATSAQPPHAGATGYAGSGQLGGPVGPVGPTTAQPLKEYYFGFVWPHVVQQGETWESISRAYRVPVAQLKQMNPVLEHTALRPGSIVYVPSVTKPKVPSTKAAPKGSYQEPAGAPEAGYPAVPGAYPAPEAGYPAAPGAYPVPPHTGYPARGQPPMMEPGQTFPPAPPAFPGSPMPGYPGPHTHNPYRPYAAGMGVYYPYPPAGMPRAVPGYLPYPPYPSYYANPAYLSYEPNDFEEGLPIDGNYEVPPYPNGAWARGYEADWFADFADDSPFESGPHTVTEGETYKVDDTGNSSGDYSREDHG